MAKALCPGCLQDEMKALQRLNTIFFLVGYLGFVAVWIMDLILIFTQVCGEGMDDFFLVEDVHHAAGYERRGSVHHLTDIVTVTLHRPLHCVIEQCLQRKHTFAPLQPATLQTVNRWIKTTFRLLSPHFCFAKGVFDVSQVGVC